MGSELISSDIIAFYELIKNAFDAKSSSGAEVSFQIVLRRRDYLDIRAHAVSVRDQTTPKSERRRFEAASISSLTDEVVRALDYSADAKIVADFKEIVGSAATLDDFIEQLDEAYKSLNTITIADTGTGMSHRDLTSSYLTIGTASRKKEVENALAAGEKKSPYLGEKGIGRLSAMRLGQRLHLESAREEDVFLNVLDVDWEAFGDLDAMVEDIEVTPHRGSKKEDPTWSGTKLVISALSEDWTQSKVQNLATYDFARITDPFADPKRRPRIVIVWNDDRIAIQWFDKALLQQAHASFSGNYSVDKGPKLQVTMIARNLGYSHPPNEQDVVTLTLPDLEGLLTADNNDITDAALTSVGPFSFEGYWYNRRNLAGVDTIGNLKTVRELQRKWSGMMLFRDGFRVFPYGEDDDDWLGQDRKALGRPGYVLNKTQFVGRVNISRMLNPNLVDQTNREGLRTNSDEQVFISILQHVVRDMLYDFLRQMDAKYKRQPIDLEDLKSEINTLEGRAKAAISRVRKLVPKEELEVVEDIQLAFMEFRDLSLKAQQKIEEVEADSRQMVQMAGVGLMVEVVAHELVRASESALTALEGLRGREFPTEVKARLDLLRTEMKSVSKRLRVLDQLSVSGRQRSEVFDLAEILKDLGEAHEGEFRRHNVKFEFRSKGPVRVKVVKGMVVQILENLVSNSMYWMKLRASREKGYIPKITVHLEGHPPTIRFSDNGKGISNEHVEKVFRPFWSLKEKSKRRGLGLFIARENAIYMDGSLTLSEDSSRETGRLHEFVFELPESATVP